MNAAVVIGGGRWGRIIATKLSALNVRVRVATKFPSTCTDISREAIGRLNPIPSLIYVASRSVDHERDFELVASLGTRVWIEKNFSGMSDRLLTRFLDGDNCVFSQQLFNTSLDRYADAIRSMRAFHISTDLDRPIGTCIGLFDWMCHDLSLMTRILWLRGETVPLSITKAVQFSRGVCTAEYVINGIAFSIVLRESRLRCRTVTLTENAALVAGRDGVLRYRSADGETDAPSGGGSTDEDLLGAALKVALESRPEDVQSLTKILVELHRVTFPLVQRLDYTRD